MSKCENCRLRKESAIAFDLHWHDEVDCPYAKCPVPDFPAAKATPDTRGHWIAEGFGTEEPQVFDCSICGRSQDEAFAYCPNCGAKMDAEEDVHGDAEWLICSDGYYPYCSNCKQEPDSGKKTKYCPNCGKKMKGWDGDDKED